MKTSNHVKQAVRFIPAVVWMGLIFYLSSVPNLELKGELSVYDFVLRKIAHVVEYAILVVLLWWGFKCTVRKKALVIIFIVSVLYAVSDEFHQSVVPTRDGKIIDVGVDLLGISGAISLIQYKYGRYHKNR